MTFSKTFLIIAFLLFLNFPLQAQTWNIPSASTSTSSFFGTTDPTSNLSIRTANLERVTITSAGKVGIGITNPTGTLELSSSYVPGLWIRSSTTNAIGLLSVSTCDGCNSTSALTNDVVLTTGQGTAGNLLLQTKNANKSIRFITYYNSELGVKMTINHDGKVGIGTNNFVGDYLFYVGGKAVCEELKIKLSANWPDFVFAKNYPLMPLTEVENYIEENQHLPNVPTAQEVKEKGIETGEMFRIQMQKIEELTLYLIEIKKENEVLKKELDALKVSIKESAE